jgi:hypothetical protein
MSVCVLCRACPHACVMHACVPHLPPSARHRPHAPPAPCDDVFASHACARTKTCVHCRIGIVTCRHRHSASPHAPPAPRVNAVAGLRGRERRQGRANASGFLASGCVCVCVCVCVCLNVNGVCFVKCVFVFVCGVLSACVL